MPVAAAATAAAVAVAAIVVAMLPRCMQTSAAHTRHNTTHAQHKDKDADTLVPARQRSCVYLPFPFPSVVVVVIAPASAPASVPAPDPDSDFHLVLGSESAALRSIAALWLRVNKLLSQFPPLFLLLLLSLLPGLCM